MFQYTPTWSIPGAGESVTVLNFNSGIAELPAVVATIRTFFSSIAGSLPNDVTITFPSEIRELDAATGQTTAFHAVTPPASVTGSATVGWAGGVGAAVTWETGQVVNGRRLRGRTFLVPLSGGVYDVDGTIVSSSLTSLQNAATALRSNMLTAGGALLVWSRTAGRADPVITAGVRDKTAILRQRRDS